MKKRVVSAWVIRQTVEYYSTVNGNILEGKNVDTFTERLFDSESLAKSTLKRGIDEIYGVDCDGMERIDDFTVKHLIDSEEYVITRFEVVECEAVILKGGLIALPPRD
jgi:hypothetical protein